MKAVVYRAYGSPDVLRLMDIDKPTPADDEVLVRVQASSVNAADWRLMRADPFVARLYTGLLKPTRIQTPGADIAGCVEAVGRHVRQFQPGDAVFGDLSADHFGGFAEYVCARNDRLVMKPACIPFEVAAAVPMAALAALHALRDKGRIRPGQSVLVHGASGGVGTFAVQLAKVFGAEVTAVCSTEKMAMTHALGADHVIDYRQVDFTLGGRSYDLILAINGHRSIFDYRRALTARGCCVMVGGQLGQLIPTLLFGPWLSRSSGQRLVTLTSAPNSADLVELRDLLASGRITPVIDRIYPLAEAAAAIRHVEQGHAAGKVVLTLEQHRLHP
jgi:NADPH:quinone reductase-like Zn-dependent oxidoreductase